MRISWPPRARRISSSLRSIRVETFVHTRFELVAILPLEEMIKALLAARESELQL